MSKSFIFVEQPKSAQGGDSTIQGSKPSTATVVGLARDACSSVSKPARVLSLNGAGSGAGEQRAGGQGGGQ